MNITSDRPLEQFKQLSVDIECRPTGSPVDRTASYIRHMYATFGFAPEQRPIPSRIRFAEHRLLELNGDVLEASAHMFSPACDLSAATVYASADRDRPMIRLFLDLNEARDRNAVLWSRQNNPS